MHSLSAGHRAWSPRVELVHVVDFLLEWDRELVLDGGVSASLSEEKGDGELLGEWSLGAEGLWLGVIVDEDGASDLDLLLHLDESVSIEIEMIGTVLERQIVGALSGLGDLDVGGSLWKLDDVMVSWREVALVETSFDGLAGGTVAVALSALVVFQGRSQLSITSNRKALSIDADVVALGVALGSVDDLIGPLVVEVSGLWLAHKLALVLSLVRTPLVVVAVESLVVELGALFGTEVGSGLAWLEVAGDVASRGASAVTAALSLLELHSSATTARALVLRLPRSPVASLLLSRFVHRNRNVSVDVHLIRLSLHSARLALGRRVRVKVWLLIIISEERGQREGPRWDGRGQKGCRDEQQPHGGDDV